jgi:hypothetical protein
MNKKVPGPSDYKINRLFEKDFKTMAVMRSYCAPPKEKTTSPGVGSYDIIKSLDFVKARISAARIGTSQRSSLNNSPRHFPGPAHY